MKYNVNDLGSSSVVCEPLHLRGILTLQKKVGTEKRRRAQKCPEVLIFFWLLK